MIELRVRLSPLRLHGGDHTTRIGKVCATMFVNLTVIMFVVKSVDLVALIAKRLAANVIAELLTTLRFNRVMGEDHTEQESSRRLGHENCLVLEYSRHEPVVTGGCDFHLSNNLDNAYLYV